MSDEQSAPSPEEGQEETAVLSSMSNYTPPVEGQETPWVPEEAINALVMEKQMRPAESNEELAERIFEENLPVAAQAVCHLALHSGNAQVRFAAARYVIERRMGKVVEAGVRAGTEDIFREFLGDVTVVVDEKGEAVGVAGRHTY